MAIVRHFLCAGGRIPTPVMLSNTACVHLFVAVWRASTRGNAPVFRQDRQTFLMMSGNLIKLVAEAWDAFERAPGKSRVEPAMPILFFGDHEAYSASPLRVVTVGLNPSLREFPVDAPFARFPACAGSGQVHGQRYLKCLSSYFHIDPYRSWFSSYEAVLDGAEASYYPRKLSTALHTDIASPVATDPTWSKLGDSERDELLSHGIAIWHQLLKLLKPHLVLLSIARKHLSRIEFAALKGNWKTLHAFNSTKSGARRKRPYTVESRWYEIMDNPALFVFGRASQTPFGQLGNEQKRKVGELSRRSIS